MEAVDPGESEGGWSLLCGGGCVGPPCYKGRFYGEVSIICECPTVFTDSGNNEWSLIEQTPNTECESDLPETVPHPWPTFTAGYTASGFVPALIFPYEDNEPGALGMWTWCPCPGELGPPTSLDGAEGVMCLRTYGPDATPVSAIDTFSRQAGTFQNYPTFQSSSGVWWIWHFEELGFHEWWISQGVDSTATEVWAMFGSDCPFGTYEPLNGASGNIEVFTCCPDDGTDCVAHATGDGYWIFRGGCPDLGPPPVAGRFYGETLAVGYCCDSSTPETSESVTPSVNNVPSSCSIPAGPLYDWTLTEIQIELPTSAENECGVTDLCGSWIWCPPDNIITRDGCIVEFGALDCPMTPPTLDGHDRGYWWLYGGADTFGAPCPIGRFFGEILWFCDCPYTPETTTSSSSPAA